MHNKKFLFEEVKIKDNSKDRLPDDCQCHCEESECEWTGIISDCETEMDSEGWEYPDFEVLVCPKCGNYSVSF